MRTHTDVEVQAFSDRLKEAATAKGFTSSSSRSGVDVGRMAEAIGSSYEMARRYAEGMAMPKPDMLQKIARWLEVPAAWLSFGEVSLGEVDETLLAACIFAVQEAQNLAGISLSADKAAPLVAALYRDARGGVEPRAQSVAAILKALQ
jgi:transcriptional regulator with XRE-family HTH domain